MKTYKDGYVLQVPAGNICSFDEFGAETFELNSFNESLLVLNEISGIADVATNLKVLSYGDIGKRVYRGDDDLLTLIPTGSPIAVLTGTYYDAALSTGLPFISSWFGFIPSGIIDEEGYHPGLYVHNFEHLTGNYSDITGISAEGGVIAINTLGYAFKLKQGFSLRNFTGEDSSDRVALVVWSAAGGNASLQSSSGGVAEIVFNEPFTSEPVVVATSTSPSRVVSVTAASLTGCTVTVTDMNGNSVNNPDVIQISAFGAI